MMLRSLIWAALLVVAVSCGGGGQVRTITDADSGSQVEVDSGDVIEVRLEENRGTGYSWEAVVEPEMLTMTSDEFEEPAGDLVGQPGTRVLQFEAVTQGAGILRLEYVRPFDDPIVPERVAEYVVIVDDATWPSEPTGSPSGTSSATAP